MEIEKLVDEVVIAALSAWPAMYSEESNKAIDDAKAALIAHVEADKNLLLCLDQEVLKLRAENERLKAATQPRQLWVIQDRGESYVDFSLYHEGVVGDPMTYRVPRECLTFLSISEIPEKAHKEGWAMWLG